MSQIFGGGSGGGGGGSPGAPVNSVQFNNPLGTFAGDANFTWVASLGLLDKKHAAIGNFAAIDSVTFAPGDPINANTFVQSCPLAINELFSGDFSGSSPEAMEIYVSWRHTGVGSAAFTGLDFEPVINSNSTGPINFLGAFYLQPTNYGSGTIDTLLAIDCAATQNAGTINHLTAVDLTNIVNGGSVGTAIAINIHTPTNTGTITNNYGLYLEDQSAIGGTISENIRSKGASSINNFEGYVITAGHTVAALIAAAAGNAGARSFVTDATQALTAGVGAVVAGGGANKVPVVSDGTNWRIG